MGKMVDEVHITNWQQNAPTVRIDQYQFDLEIKWTDELGVKHQHNGNYKYPNDISDMPLAVKKRFANEMIIATVRVTLGIEDWEDYE